MMHLSVDVGGTYIKYGWMSNGQLIKKGKVKTPYTSHEDFISLITNIFNSGEFEKSGLSISHPGTIDQNNGYIYQGGSLRYNSQINLKEVLEERLSVPVSIENDARCAALAEMIDGNMKGVENGIVLTFGTGVGCCLIINNQIYRGSHLFSGEVSGILTKDIREFGLDSILGRQLGVGKLCEKVCVQKGVEIQEGKVVLNWIINGDSIAVKVFEEYCETLTSQLFNWQLILDPEKVCIGGGISENKFFVEKIKESMNKFYKYFPVAIPRFEIEECKYHNDANLIGAYYHYMNKKSFID